MLESGAMMKSLCALGFDGLRLLLMLILGLELVHSAPPTRIDEARKFLQHRLQARQYLGDEDVRSALKIFQNQKEGTLADKELWIRSWLFFEKESVDVMPYRLVDAYNTYYLALHMGSPFWFTYLDTPVILALVFSKEDDPFIKFMMSGFFAIRPMDDFPDWYVKAEASGLLKAEDRQDFVATARLKNFPIILRKPKQETYGRVDESVWLQLAKENPPIRWIQAELKKRNLLAAANVPEVPPTAKVPGAPQVIEAQSAPMAVAATHSANQWWLKVGALGLAGIAIICGAIYWRQSGKSS